MKSRNFLFIQRPIGLWLSFVLLFSLPIQAEESSKQSNASTASKTDSVNDNTPDTLTLAVKSLKTTQAVIANNIANAETPGFKKSRVILADNGYRHETLPGRNTALGTTRPRAFRLAAAAAFRPCNSIVLRERSSRPAGIWIWPSKAAVSFKFRIPTALRFTPGQASSQKIPNGQLVICSAGTGRLMEPVIQLPQDATRVVITAEGMVSVGQPGNTQLQQVGQIQLSDFVNPEGLLKLGENLYRETDASGPPTQNHPGRNGAGVLRQGFIESSNVDLDDEIRELKRLRRICRKIEFLIDED